MSLTGQALLLTLLGLESADLGFMQANDILTKTLYVCTMTITCLKPILNPSGNLYADLLDPFKGPFKESLLQNRRWFRACPWGAGFSYSRSPGSGRLILDSERGNFKLFGLIWEFPKTRGTVFWGPYSKDPTI